MEPSIHGRVRSGGGTVSAVVGGPTVRRRHVADDRGHRPEVPEIDGLPGTLKTLNKAGRVLDLFGVDKDEWRLTEIADALGLSKSSAHSLLASMSDIGLLTRTHNSRYRLGWRLLTLGETLLSSSGFSRTAQVVAQGLVARFQETVHFATLQGNQIMCVNIVDGTHPVRVGASRIGICFGIHAGVSKVLLANLPWTQAEKIVQSHGMAPMTSKTITTVAGYRAELERVAAQGWAVDAQECFKEVCCVAAPIRNQSGRVSGAMSIAAPSYRFVVRRAAYRSAVVEAAGHISQLIDALPSDADARASVR
ncbi:MAG TPA: IclR family transcriptional regulator [Solirubrobacteraceae bacterium]|nr:IclR family transcriptional regulator [Solirubrobacteraceae bacterium]